MQISKYQFIIWLNKVLTPRSYPKKIAWWVGSDAVKKVIMPPGNLLFKLRVLNGRLVWKIAHRFYNEHWINHAPLAKALVKFGIPEHKIHIHETPYLKHFYGRDDSEFTVLFYINKGKTEIPHRDWIYGKEYYEEIIKHFNTILIDGDSDMAKIYPLVDVYIKINATPYSDLNRIGKECLYTGIPVLVQNTYDKSVQQNKEEIVKWINTKKDTWPINKKRKSS